MSGPEPCEALGAAAALGPEAEAWAGGQVGRWAGGARTCRREPPTPEELREARGAGRGRGGPRRRNRVPVSSLEV